MRIANYKEHTEAFKALLHKNCAKKILLFKGESGSGKSTLMTHCRNQINSDIHHVPVDLRDTNNALQIFLKAGKRLGWENFQNFERQGIELGRELNISVNGNTQAGVGNLIQVELKALFENATPEQRSERYSTLTNAWVEDIDTLNKPCILLLDVYDQASSDMQRWITGDLLNCAADSRHMRVVVAGKIVPDSFAWNHCRELKELYGVHEAEEWLPVVQSMGRIVPAQNPIDFLAGICYTLNGNPGAIAKVIESFPRQQ